MKNRNRIILSFLGSLFLITNLLLVMKITRERTLINQLRENLAFYNAYYDVVKGNIFMHYTYNDCQLADFVVLDINNNKKKFSDLLGDDYKLLFKYSHCNCSSCVDAELENVIKASKLIGGDRVLIIAEYSNLRELTVYLKERQVNIPVYLIDEGGPDLLQKENMPFVGVIKNTLELKQLFIPIKEISDYSGKYYDIIFSRYFDYSK